MAASTITIQGLLTPGAADAFIQAAINTGLTGQDNTAFRIKEILLDYPSPIQGANIQTFDFQITRGSKAALVNYSDTSLIIRDARATVTTTTGSMFVDRVKDFVPQGDLIIVESAIYLGFKTSAAGAVVSLGYKLVLEEIKVTADQRISILSARLP